MSLQSTSVDAELAAPTPRRRNKVKRKQTGWLFLAPFALLFTFVLIVPISYSAYLSVFKNALVGGTSFVGFDNYVKLMADDNFWDAVRRVLLFTAVQVPIMLLSAALIALALDSRRLRGTNFARISVFLPYAVPAIVSTLIWGFMLGVRYGLFKSFNEGLGTSIDPFTPPLTLVSIGVMITWAFTGYNVLIFYSALKAIPHDLYEAASIDGAKQRQIIRFVKLPALRGSITITVIFSIIGTFQMFNEPQILPAIVSNSGITTHYTPNMYAYQLAFTGSEHGYAAALALVMALITVVLAYAVQLWGMRRALD